MALIDPSLLSKMDEKMDLLILNMKSILSSVDYQGKKISKNTKLINAQAPEIKCNVDNITEIFLRLDKLNTGGPQS